MFAFVRRLLITGPVALIAPMLAFPAQTEWRKTSTDRFVIYSEGGEASLREQAERLQHIRPDAEAGNEAEAGSDIAEDPDQG